MDMKHPSKDASLYHDENSYRLAKRRAARFRRYAEYKAFKGVATFFTGLAPAISRLIARAISL